jgi:putative transposase
MWLGAGRILRDDQSLPSGSPHTAGKSRLRHEVAAVDVCEPLPPVQEVARQAFPRTLQNLIVDESTHLGSLLHYVHLNPVRAGMCTADELTQYRWSSYWYLHHPDRRPSFLDLGSTLTTAGGLVDSKQGRSKYRDYLKWLATDDVAQEEMAFAKMCRGWALGGANFKRKMFDEIVDSPDKSQTERLESFEGRDLKEVNEIMWERELTKALVVCEKTPESIHAEMKSAPWKVMIACALKQRTSASNPWITSKLNMGIPQAVSLHVGRYRKSQLDRKSLHLALIQRLTE